MVKHMYTLKLFLLTKNYIKFNNKVMYHAWHPDFRKIKISFRRDFKMISDGAYL